ncbi:charged multivesicular body protein 3 isoform X1 [Octopus bimaculoides]|nr:charged multivesicular body protein 3 isoform X1 [Octopus bimaculoides]
MRTRKFAWGPWTVFSEKVDIINTIFKMGLFGKTPQRSPKESVQEWCSKMRKEGYVIDRQIRAIKREEEKTKRSLKESAKKGEKDACVILAKELVHSKKAVCKLYAAKAHLNSVQLNMKQQLGKLRMAGALEKSVDVMKAMHSLIKIPEINSTMMEMSKEMMKAGIIEEMLEDTFEGLEDAEELEDESQKEVDKVLYELTAGELGKMPSAVKDSLPLTDVAGATAATASSALEEEENDEEEDEMRARLEALRS